MNKGELTKSVADSAGMSQAEAGRAVDAVFESISGAVKSVSRWQLPVSVLLSLKHVAPREGRNPATGETIQIKEKTSAAFKPASALKDI